MSVLFKVNFQESHIKLGSKIVGLLFACCCGNHANFFFFSFFLLMFEYNCLHFTTTTFPHPTHTHLPPNPTPPWLHPWVPHTCSFTSFSLLSHVISLPLPLWLLSVCCQCRCHWPYFACQFVLLIPKQSWSTSRQHSTGARVPAPEGTWQSSSPGRLRGKLFPSAEQLRMNLKARFLGMFYEIWKHTSHEM